MENPILVTALKRAERRLRAAQEDLARVQSAPALQREAELLKTVRVKRFEKEVVATDYSQVPPLQVRIALNPGESLAQQIDKRFHAAKRLLAAEPKVRARIAEVEKQIADLHAAETSGQTEGVIALLPPPPKTRAEKAAEPLPYREYFSPTGRAVWVGKGATKNDALTFRFASPHALWLHATGFAGAHVVVPARRDEEVDAATIDTAARLAAHFSKAPDGFVEVALTQVKFVRKMKRAKAGQVAVSRERQYRVDNDPVRAKNILTQPPSVAPAPPPTHDNDR